MVLVGVIGGARAINRDLILEASRKTPSLILDCSNCANPHALYPQVPQERLKDIFVMEIELLYKLRDTLRRIPYIRKEKNIDYIIVTAFGELFNYGDSEENREVFMHSWELLKKISEDCEIHVAIGENSIHEPIARRFCDVIKNGTHSLEPKNYMRHYP